MKVFYIHSDNSETEMKVERCPANYLDQLETEKQSLIGMIVENGSSRFIINEGALETLVNEATNSDRPANHAKRAAQAANMIQADIMSFKDAGEMFLQQIICNPIAELFCAFSRFYCANKKVTCAHGVYVREDHEDGSTGNRVQYSASCSPDAALRLVTGFDLIAMMELKCDDDGDPYKKDLYKCKLMTAMSVMAIADYLDEFDLIERDKIDVAIPFIQGRFGRVDLYVMRRKGIVGRPKSVVLPVPIAGVQPKMLIKWIFYPNWQ